MSRYRDDNETSHETVSGLPRATKRRRLDSKPELSHIADPQAQDRILLYLLDIKILLGDSEAEDPINRPNGLESALDGFHVIVQNFEHVKSGHFRCKLSDDNGTRYSCTFDTAVSPKTIRLLHCALDYQGHSKHRSCQTSFYLICSSYACQKLRFEISWRNARSLGEASTSKENDILALLTGGDTAELTDAWSPRDFYDSVHVPAKDSKEAESLVVEDLESTLFPYQKRTVLWMLRREGVDVDGRTFVPAETVCDGEHGFLQIISPNGVPIWVNPWLGLASNDQSLLEDSETTVSGVSSISF